MSNLQRQRTLRSQGGRKRIRFVLSRQIWRRKRAAYNLAAVMRNHSWSTQLIGSWLILIGWRPADGIALKLSGRVILMCGCLLVGAVGPVTVVRGEIITIGANVVNPQRLSAADREALLDQLQ